MNRGFYTILAAQFFSALADNALLFAAIALLKQVHAPEWQTPVLQMFFVFSYIALAPFVGPFADSLPKGRVMFISNGVKIAGCVAMLAGLQPLFAYGIVGIGAAMYSPAKYGILTELLPSERLVAANGWMEGLTVASIIFGAVLGGYLVGDTFSAYVFAQWDFLTALPRLDTGPEIAILVMLLLYAVAALVNLYIPRLAIDHRMPRKDPVFILQDFWHSFWLLWRDPLGQVSLAVTTLFWGAGATLRLIVLVWAEKWLGFTMQQSTQLTAVVAVGIAIGSVAAARYVRLERSVQVLPVGIAMGVLVMGMVFVHDWRIAMVLLVLAGAMGGFFVVPMNALLQHRGHLLMGAGHSIAVQNFNENLSILAMQGCYALMIGSSLSYTPIIVLFGGFIAVVMALLYRRHGHDQDHGQT
ncbi:MAG: lysophospholipid transporter LplT [Betaproteobacteria bacterium]|nr:lysophospholipid transporter LplT [Betaproteobacteria bacterium]MBL8534387.1 lysophospholipid transporter LplT [Betaproteobacteria bacterium]